MSAEWTTLGTKTYTISVEEAVSLSGSIAFQLNGNPVSGQAKGSVNSTLTANYTVSAEVHGSAKKYVKASLLVNGKEVGSKTLTITETGTYKMALPYQFEDAGDYEVKAILYEGDNMTDWTELAQSAISVTITAPVKNPELKLELSPIDAKPTDKVTAIITVGNPNTVEITGTVYLGYVDSSTHQFVPKYTKQVTVPANNSATITTQFTPEDWGLSPGTYDVGVQGKFTVNGNSVVVSGNSVQLTVEKSSSGTVNPPVVTVSVSPNSVTVGEKVTITATVKNPNNQSATASAVLEITDPDGLKKSLTPNGWMNFSIPANGTKALTYEFTPSKAGVYEVDVNVIMAVGQVQKSAKSNTASITVNSQNAPKPPELVVGADKNTVEPGEPVSVGVTIKNMAQYPITGGKVNILVDNNVVATLNVPEIGVGKETTLNKQITLNKLGKHEVSANGTFTINGQQVSASGNAIPITVVSPQGDDFMVYLSYPNSITAGDGFTLSISVKDTGQTHIIQCTAKVTATQYDENGNPVATIGPLTVNLGEIHIGQSSSNSVMIMSKDVPGQITGNVEVEAKFSDFKTMSKEASFNVQVTSPSPTPGGETSGGISISTPVLIGAGLVGLLLLTNRHGGEKR